MDLVDRLLDLDVECSQADKNLWTPLTYAAAGGHASCVRALLESGASAGDVDTHGRTALHWAAERGWADVVTSLVPAMALEGRDVGLLVSMPPLCPCLHAHLGLGEDEGSARAPCVLGGQLWLCQDVWYGENVILKLSP